LEAESAYRRLEEEKRSLSESLTATQSEVVRLGESLVCAGQALKEHEGLVREAESRAETHVRRASRDLRRIRVAYYLQGHLDGKADVAPKYRVEDMAGEPSEEDDEAEEDDDDDDNDDDGNDDGPDPSPPADGREGDLKGNGSSGGQGEGGSHVSAPEKLPTASSDHVVGDAPKAAEPAGGSGAAPEHDALVRDPQEAREVMPRDAGSELLPDASGPGTGTPVIAPSEVGS
jgi:hypothetical protein